jgi:GT2 family glycosyltransferase
MKHFSYQVSVIIVNYNTGKLLTQAVKSVIEYEGVEVIVVDNASRDDSMAQLAKSVKRSNLKIILNNDNLGFGKATNMGVKSSKGEYIYLLNPDAKISKQSLSRMVETAKEYGDRAVIAPRLLDPDGTPQASCYQPQTISNAVKEYWLGIKGAYSKYLPSGKKSIRVYAAVAAAWLIHRSVWDEMDGLDSKYFLYFEDMDFCDRANAKGIPIIYDPVATVQHEHGASSRTNPIVAKLFLNSAKIYHGFFKKATIDAIIRIRDFFIPPISTKKVILIVSSYIALVIGVMALSYFLLPARYAPSGNISSFWHSNFMLWSSANFDGDHYLSIAKQGYQAVNGQSQYAFLPLYPLLINILGRLGIDNYLAARFIGIGSLLGFALVLVKWATPYLKNPLHLLWLVLLSPGTIFLTSVYTEPLFLFLVVLTFYFADQKQWSKAALVTALATATRVNGLFLVTLLFAKLWQSKAKIGTVATYMFTACLGIFSYMGYLYARTGDALAWYHAQSGWEKSTATWPWITASNYVQALTLDFVPDLTHLVVLIELGLTLFLIFLLYKLWRSKLLDVSYKYYALFSLALPIVTGSLGSMPRFSLTMLPLFLMLTQLPKATRFIVYFLFVSSAITGIILFSRGYWYA